MPLQNFHPLIRQWFLRHFAAPTEAQQLGWPAIQKGRDTLIAAVCPGLIDTEMVRANVTAERLESYRGSFPIQRLGTPNEVADLICFLGSERAGYVTGAAFDITGGDLMV